MASFSFTDDFKPDTFGVADKDGREHYGILPRDGEKEIFERTLELGDQKYSFVCSLSDNLDLQKSLLTLACESAKMLATPRFIMRSELCFFNTFSLLCVIIKSEISENARIEEIDTRDTRSCVRINEKGFLACVATLFMFALNISQDTSLSLSDGYDCYTVSIKTGASFGDFPQFVIEFCKKLAETSGLWINYREKDGQLELMIIAEKVVATTLIFHATFDYNDISEVFRVIELMQALQQAEKRRKELI